MPLYYASLCGFRGLVEHLIASHSPDVNSRGGFHTTPLHAASAKGFLKVVQMLTLVTIWEGLRFTGYHKADSLSWRSHHSRLRGSS